MGFSTVSEARAAISELVTLAEYSQERTVLTKHNREVAAIVPISDLKVLESLQGLGLTYLSALRARHLAETFVPPFEQVEGLASWLTNLGLATEQWGKNGSKSVQDLWLETSRGESQIQLDPPRRIVHVAVARIFKDVDSSLELLEVEQKSRDGSTRSRMQPLAEKLRPNEDPLLGLIRGIEEELQIKIQHVRIDADSRSTQTREYLSPSYPGLTTLYTTHTFKAYTDILPAAEFTIKEGDPLSPSDSHTWDWRIMSDDQIDRVKGYK